MAKNRKKSSFRGKVRKDSKRQGTGYGYLLLPKGVSVFNPEMKTTVELDFMPYEVTSKRHFDRNIEDEIAVPGSLWYKRPFKRHRDIGVNNEKVVCPTSVGKPCPICEKRAELIRKNADKDDTDALKESKRNLYCVIPLDSKKHDVIPHIMDISQYLFQDELNETNAEKEDYELFPDLEEGYTLKCRIDASTIGSSKPFSEIGKITMLKREKQYTEDILDEIPNLDEVLQILSYKELEAKFLELDEDDVKDDDETTEDEPPTRSKPRTRTDKSEDKEKTKEEEQDRKRKERKEKKAKEEASSDNNGCPHGHKFGVDCDEYKEDCEPCDKWDDCGDEQDKIK